MSHKTCASACIAAFFFVFSCVSISKNTDDEKVRYETYATFDLFFTFTYPKTWSIFENKKEVQFSNNVVLLTNPKDKQHLTPQSFLGSIYLSDSSFVQIVHAGITKHALFLSLSRDGAFAQQEKKKQISIQELQKLSDVITGNEYTIVQNSYERAFEMPLSTHVRGYTIGATVLLVDSFFEKNTLSEGSHSGLTKPREAVVIRATAVRKIKDEIFAVLTSVYHTNLVASTHTEDQLLIKSEEQHQTFLQDIVHAVQSIQLNAFSLE